MKKSFLILLSILAVLTVYILYYIQKYKILSKAQVKEVNLSSGKLVYTQYKGDYYKITNSFNAAKNAISSQFGSKIKMFGIYYDNPGLLVNKNDARAIIGAIFDNSQEIDKFLSENAGFKSFAFSDLQGFGSEFIFSDTLSILIAVIKGYPAIRKYFEEKKINFEFPCFLESYDYKEGKMIISFLDAKNNKEISNLSIYDAPVLKDFGSKKND